MRFDKPGGDAQIGFGEAAVDGHRRATCPRAAEIDVGGLVPGVMVLDPDFGQNPRVADEFRQFRTKVRPVQPRGHQHGDAVERDAGRDQRLDHRA